MITIQNNEVKRKCGMCGHESHIMLLDDELAAYRRYLSGNGQPVQYCLPTLNCCEREFLKSGYCIECQELLFGNGETEKIY